MSQAGELRLHLRKVRDEMGAAGIFALFTSDEKDLYYLSGRNTGRILVTGSQAILWVRDIYLELYDSTYSSGGYPLETRVFDKDDLQSTLRSMRAKTVGVPNAGAIEALRKASRRRVVVCDAIKRARSIKTGWEIEMIRRSCLIAKAGMRKARDVIRPGVRELDAVAEIEAELRRRGSEKAAFGEGILFASGAGGADIHAKASFHRIGRGPTVVDLGATYREYFSDMTRTFAVGRLSPQERDVMDFVCALKDETIDGIRPGMLASSVHKEVESAIMARGYKFHHLSGHGVGLDIHEQPSFSPDNNVRLRAGMVFTVEPGIYLPGKFGVRFEDTVLLTGGGCRKLT